LNNNILKEKKIIISVQNPKKIKKKFNLNFVVLKGFIFAVLNTIL
jgi:hypothetical protein